MFERWVWGNLLCMLLLNLLKLINHPIDLPWFLYVGGHNHNDRLRMVQWLEEMIYHGNPVAIRQKDALIKYGLLMFVLICFNDSYCWRLISCVTWHIWNMQDLIKRVKKLDKTTKLNQSTPNLRQGLEGSLRMRPQGWKVTKLHPGTLAAGT